MSFTLSEDADIDEVFIESVEFVLENITTGVVLYPTLYQLVDDEFMSIKNGLAQTSISAVTKYELQLVSDYDDIVTLTPGSTYMLDVRFIYSQDNKINECYFLQITNDNSTAGEAEFDNDFDGYFTDREMWVGSFYDEPDNYQLLDNNSYLAMRINYGCVFYSRDQSDNEDGSELSRGIEAEPLPECDAIQIPSTVLFCTAFGFLFLRYL